MATTQNRRNSVSSAVAKRQAMAENNHGKLPAGGAKKRPALTNISNHTAASARNSLSHSSKLAPCTSKVVSIKKSNSNAASSVVPTSSSFVKPISKTVSLPRSDAVVPKITAIPLPATSSMDISPSHSDGSSVSMDESMSTSSDTLRSPDVEYIDDNQTAAFDSIEKKAFSTLYISEDVKAADICKRDVLVDMELGDKIANIDNNLVDPQLCATMACDIYKHLRATEVKKRPSTDFMEKVQKDINASMRAILIDWLVEVAEEYRLVPDTLYLTVNYIDRYLSGNLMDRQRLQLLGVACMMIASKYEEICAPQVEEFCYITDNTYFKEEVLQMESTVLNYLKFEMTAPTAKCFLRRFVRAAQGLNEVLSLQLEHLASYIAELSLLEYNMLCYAPSVIAASAIFLAKYILLPSKKPWNSTLRHYTLYQPSDLRDCVMALHSLCCNNNNSSLPAIREKYSQHRYKFVAKKYCPPTIPVEFFQNISC
ncbi:PREDICTED: cyclin-A1-4-like [Nicotiana attenuata]|uniref:Cyclin-a1-3 n=1 Tax=Nicotiana attenuata TaxID=49451 RepID=A0A1J6J033_NICAT|nr:PREDICTED: cyclin-A1-4-like [Nicotiana attenuata]OIT03255.1 cyclin-a1-3 [Nicotiana attenuata]